MTVAASHRNAAQANQARLFNSPLIKHFLPSSTEKLENADEIVYHYTSPEAFLSIIQNQAIRFTDIRYLNDTSEGGVYFAKLLLEFVDKHHDRFPLFNDVVNGLLSGNDFDKIKKLDTTAVSYPSIPGLPYKNRVFVFCACNGADSLNMWNYYVNNGSYQGYNIGFRPTKLLKTFDIPDPSVWDAFSVYYGNVIYDNKTQFSEIERFAKWIESRLIISPGRPHPVYTIEQAQFRLHTYIRTYGLFYKHPKFKSEDEFRFLIEIHNDRIPRSEKEAEKYIGKYNRKMKQGFCCKQGLVVPFLSISLPEDSIYRVTLSPMTESNIAKDSIRELLATSGFKNISIYRSSIPIRF